MTASEKPNVRKVWLPSEMKAAVEHYCWTKRTKPSPYIVSLIERIIANPTEFAGASIPPAGTAYASIYVHDDVWLEGGAVAKRLGTRLSALVRVAIAADLAAEGIPWDATTKRPLNEHIPVSE